MSIRPFAHFAIALLEAPLKCAPVFIIRLLAIYPLVVVALHGEIPPGWTPGAGFRIGANWLTS